MIEVINVTPHNLTLQDESGEVFYVSPSGVIINATPTTRVVGTHSSGATLLETTFSASPETEALLETLEAMYPNGIIVGSLVAAQAFPGRVFGLVPVPGFERVPPEQKRMRADAFTSFAK